MSNIVQEVKVKLAEVLFNTSGRISKLEKDILLIHSFMLTKNLTAIAFENNSTLIGGVLNDDWNNEKDNAVYSFRYKDNKGHTYNAKYLKIDTNLIGANMINEGDQAQLSSVELKASEFSDLDSAITFLQRMIREKFFDLIGISNKVEEKKKIGGFDLRPVQPQIQTGGLFGPRYPIGPDLRVGNSDILPTGLGEIHGSHGSSLMGPDHPFFRNQNQQFRREDPPFPFGPGLGGQGPGGFGSGGNWQFYG